MSRFARLTGFPVLCCTALVCLFPVSASGQDHEHEYEQMRMEGQVRKKYIVKLETTQHKQYCQASASIEYIQNNDVASVSGEIENQDCEASSGTYTMNVRFRDQNGEVHDLNFDETWQRDDDQSILFNREYSIGKNVDLIRVRTRRMKCVCAKVQSESEHEKQIQNQE